MPRIQSTLVRSFLFTSLLASVPCDVAAAQTSAVAPACKDLDEALTAWMERNVSTDGERVFVLAFDHRQERWHGYEWKKEALDASSPRRLSPLFEPTLEMPLARPRLEARQGNRLLVVVADTNPLLYTTRRLKPSETAVDELASLEALSRLAAGVLSRGLIAPTPDEVAASSTEAPSFEEIDPPAVSEDVRVALHDAITTIAEKNKTDVKALRSRLNAIQPRAKAVQALRSELAESLAKAHYLVQRVEKDQVAPLLKRKDHDEEIHEELQALSDVVERLRAADDGCAGSMSGLRSLLQIRLFQDSSANRKTAEEVYRKLRESLTLPSPTLAACPDAELSNAISILVDALGPRYDATLPGTLSEPLRQLEHNLGIQTALLELRGKTLVATGEVLAKRDDLLRSGSLYDEYFGRQQRHHDGASDLCALRHGIVKVTEASPVDHPQMNRIRQQPFEITPDPALAKVVLSRPAKVETSYEVVTRRGPWSWDVDFGLIYTDLVDPTFGAVAVDGGDEKSIAVTAQPTRSGDVAAFLTWVPVRHRLFEAGPQIGFGLDPDKPAAFLGWSFGLRRYLKLSVGRTWQEVTSLAGGLELGQSIASEDDIQTRTTFDRDWYAALTLTLSDLPFFQPK